MSRFTVDTDAQFDSTLAELVKMTGGTTADVIRKAVATYKFLKTEDQDPANRISVTQGGAIVKDIILP